jgi:hypothetical protein
MKQAHRAGGLYEKVSSEIPGLAKLLLVLLMLLLVAAFRLARELPWRLVLERVLQRTNDTIP